MKRLASEHNVDMEAAIRDALLEAQAPILPSPQTARTLRERILERVRAPEPPGSLNHLHIPGEAGTWIRLLPGIQMKLLREDETTRSYLLRMAPGARLPAHDHCMDEECVVLEGEVSLGDTLARAGDYHLARSGVPHGEVRTRGGCLLFLRGQKHYASASAG